MSKIVDIMSKDTWNLFWFNNPDVNIDVNDEKVSNRIRQLGFESTFQPKRGLINDIALFHSLGYYVFYLQAGRWKHLVAFINKMCGLDIGAGVNVMKFNIGNDVFIISKYIKIYPYGCDSPSDQSIMMQETYYCKRMGCQITPTDLEECTDLVALYRNA